MTKMIAYCGLVCSDCPSFFATRNDDDEARGRTAAFYKEKFGLNFKPEEINCDGCRSDEGMLIAYCRTCEVRQWIKELKAACPVMASRAKSCPNFMHIRRK
jgi:hypothetical protein